MYRKSICLLVSAVLLLMVSCNSGKTESSEQQVDSLLKDSVASDSVSLQEEDELPLLPTGEQNRVDELFDDFLFLFVRSRSIQRSRNSSGSACDFSFMSGEYCTNLYSSRAEMMLNEDTMLTSASVERIDLGSQMITSFKFAKSGGKWRLIHQDTYGFENSDMCDFLEFYSHFTTDSTFQTKSMARSIGVSMTDPDDENQTIDGFIDREQWSTICESFPSGVISNIRYGQIYHGRHRMMLEKMAMGEGLGETFTFEKRGGEWKLTQFEN